MEKHNNLIELDISNNQLGIKGIQQIQKIKESSNLKQLNLSKNNIGDEGAMLFA